MSTVQEIFNAYKSGGTQGVISLAKDVEAQRTSNISTSSSNVHPEGFVGPTVQEANIVSNKPKTVFQNFISLPIQEKISLLKTMYNVPSEVRTADASTEYRRYVMASYLGMPTSYEEKQLSSKLQSSYWYMSSQQKYTYQNKQLSWSELHAKEPALYLTQTKVGTYIPTYDFLRWRSEYNRQFEDKGLGFARDIGNVGLSYLSIFDVGTWKAAIGGNLPSYLAEKQYRDVMDIKMGKGWEVWGRVQAPAYQNVIMPLAVGYGIGAGIGALKATSVGSKALLSIGSRTLSVGGAVELGVFGYSSYEIGKSAISDPLGTGISLAISSPSAVLGYRTGASMGYGAMETYLYGKHTFMPGSVDLIRFKEAIKIGRQTQFIRSSYGKPLDFAKDIMRLKPSEAENVIGYLRSEPSSVIGGSASSYTQVKPSLWSTWRGSVKPRDIDILVKNVVEAKGYFGRSPHKIDIHGFEFGGKSGQYYRFGFITQSPKRIGEFKYLRLSEQSFRKGVSSVQPETSYRAFKDVPDFIMSSEQLISSGRVSWNPITRFRASIAAKHLDVFMNPSKSVSFGKSESFFGKSFKRFVKPSLGPKTVESGGYIDYVYPKSIYPKNYVGFSFGSYFKPSVFSYKPVISKPVVSKISGYKSNIGKSFDMFVPISIFKPYGLVTISTYKIPKISTPNYIPPYKPPSIIKPPNYVPPYNPPSYIPPKIPPYKPPEPPTTIPPSKPPVKIDELFNKRKEIKIPKEIFDIGYKYREFKLTKLFKNLKI